MRKPIRGRALFHVARPVLIAVAKVLAFLPNSLLEVMLALVRYVPTILGVALRYSLAKALFEQCGNSVFIGDGVHLLNGRSISAGDNVSFHPMSYVDATGGLSIGNDVSIAHHVTIMTTTHTFERSETPIKDQPLRHMAVNIGDNVWLGAGCRILAGVEIGDRSIVGAGAVVTNSIPRGVLALGVPARVAKELQTDEGSDA